MTTLEEAQAYRAPLERVAAYKALDSERDYQDDGVQDPDKPSMKPLTPGEILLAMEYCIKAASANWYHEAHPHPMATEFIRKIGGLAVQYMEQYGAPQREGFKR